MVEAKGTTQAKTTVPPKPLDKEKSRAAGKSVAALSGKRKVQKKDNGPIIYVAMAVFAVLMVFLFAFALKKKPAAAGGAKTVAQDVSRKAKKAAGDVAQAVTGRKKRAAPAAAGSAAAAPTPKRTSRSAGLRSSQPLASRTERVRTPRVRRERTVSSRRGGSKRSADTEELTAIGEGTAMFGKRTVRVGDVLRGRIVREIAADGVKLEYAGATFSVRIGEALP